MPLPEGLAEIAGSVVDQLGRTPRRSGLQLLGAGGDGGDPGPQLDAELHGGQADPASGPEHDQLLPRLHPGHRSEHVVRRAVGDTEGRGGLVGDTRRDRGEGGRPDHDLLGERPDEGRPEDPVANGHRVHVVGHLGDLAGELAAGDEGQRRGHLVVVGDDQDVGEVHCGGVDPYPGLAGADLGRRELVDHHDVGRAVGPTDRGPHVR